MALNETHLTASSARAGNCLRIHSPGDLRVERMEPSAPAAGQVSVRVAFGGICGSDLHYFHHGGFGAVRIKRPMILGHEVAGVVEDVAPDVTGIQRGDRVAVNPSRPCGACEYCLEGLPNQCLDMRFYGSAMRDPHIEGAFRNLLVCDARQCAPIAPGISLECAALAGPFSVALHGVSRAGSLLGKRVLVAGCGPIGTLAVGAAKLHGARHLIAVDINDEPLAVARAMGADETLNAARDSGWTERFSANKGTFDVLFECSGSEQSLRAGLTVMRPRGIVVQLGLGGDVSIAQNVLVTKELCLCGSFRFHAEFALAVDLINKKRVDLSPMITARMPLRSAREAFELASDRKRAMKVLLAFGEPPANGCC